MNELRTGGNENGSQLKFNSDWELGSAGHMH